MPRPTMGNRLRNTAGGLFVTAISTVFIVFGIATMVQSVHRASTYLPATATIDKITNPDTTDVLSIGYSFTVDSRRYTGALSARENEKAKYAELKQHQVGEHLTVYYNPANPAESQRSVEKDASTLMFVIFVMPFLLIGVNQLWSGLSGREIIPSRRPNAQSVAVPGGGLFWVFTLTCVAGAFAHAVACQWLSWPWSLASGLTILFVAIPAVNLFAFRLIKRWRSAKSAKMREVHELQMRQSSRHSEDADNRDDDPEIDVKQYLVKVGGLGKKLAIALGATLFWCGITGVFTVVGVGMLAKAEYARLYYHTTQGVVISSKIKTTSNGESTHFIPKVKYRYKIADQEFINDQYSFAQGLSGNTAYARKAVNENPPGKVVTVYYNPDNPTASILSLDAPGLAYFILLFLQPFLLVGMMLIGWCIFLPLNHARTVKLLASDGALPWTVPGWGTMQQDFDGLTLRERRSPFVPLGYFALGYGITCFFTTFIAAFSHLLLGDFNVAFIQGIFVLAACVGVVTMLWKLYVNGGPGRITIDLARKRLCVHYRRQDYDVPLDAVSCLRFRSVPYPGRIRLNGQSRSQVLLEAVIRSAPRIPLHAFRWQSGSEEETLAIAQKAQSLLAQLIGCSAVKSIAEVE